MPHKGPWLAFFESRAVHVFDITLNQWLPTVIETSDDILLAVPIAEEHLVVTVETTGRIRLMEITSAGSHLIQETTTRPLHLAAFAMCSHHLAVIDTEQKLRVIEIK